MTEDTHVIENETKFFSNLFDIIYGIILSLSFLNLEQIIFPTSKLYNWNGITLALGAFFAYYLVMSGWYGLHRSVENKKFNPNIKWSKIRFALNLVIIFLEFYLVALATGVIIDLTDQNSINQTTNSTSQTIDWNNPQDLNRAYHAMQKSYSDIFIWVIPIVYAVYLLWDVVKLRQFQSERNAEKDKTKKQKINDDIPDITKRTIYTATILASFIALSGFYSFVIKSHPIKDFSMNLIFIAISFGLVFIYRVVLKGGMLKNKKGICNKTLIPLFLLGCFLIILGLLFIGQSMSTIGPQSWFTYNNPGWTLNGSVISLMGIFILIFPLNILLFMEKK